MPQSPSRRTFIKKSAYATFGFAVFPFSRIQPVTSFDVVVKGGTLLDGTGGPPWPADLGLIGDTIAATGSIAPEQGKLVIDASGFHVSPGFIDIHTHSDSSILRYPTADSRIRQGVTTEITGNCGYAVAPLEGMGMEEMRKELKEEANVNISWSSVASYFDVLEKMGISVNHALLLGQGSLRQNAIGPTIALLRKTSSNPYSGLSKKGWSRERSASQRVWNTFRDDLRQPTKSSPWRALWVAVAASTRLIFATKKRHFWRPSTKPSR